MFNSIDWFLAVVVATIILRYIEKVVPIRYENSLIIRTYVLVR